MSKWYKILLLCCTPIFLIAMTALSQTQKAPRGDACPHPINFRQVAADIDDGETLHFEYAWDSPTGKLIDLAYVWVGEYVTYDDDGVHPPPWKGFSPNPTVIFVNGSDGGANDNHHMPGHRKPENCIPAIMIATQYYGYHCFRCRKGEGTYGTKEWQVDLMGPIIITKYVEFVNGQWQYRIEKNGLELTIPLP